MRIIRQFTDESPRNERVGKQAKGSKAPRSNQAQNAQTDAVAKELGLTPKQARQLHDAVGKQGYGYQEILELAKEMFGIE